MATYNDDLYHDAIVVYIGDIYYSDVSYDAKIGRMRALAENIVRRLTKHNPNSMLELGDQRTRQTLDRLGMTESFFRDSLEIVRKGGNASNHSKVTRIGEISMPTEEDFDEVSNAMLNLYGYLYYDFFKKHEFGSNGKILTAFSLLPPSFRFRVLKEMLFSDLCNIHVVDKIRLAFAKSFDLDVALDRVRQDRERLSQIPMPYSSEDMKLQILLYGMENIAAIMQKMQESVYDYLIREVPDTYHTLKAYDSAKRYYLTEGIIEGDSEDVVEFNALMKFIYLGRKAIGTP